VRNVLRRRRLNASLLLGFVSAATAAAGIAAPVPATVQPYTPPDPSTLPNASATMQQPTVFKGAPGARNAHVRPQSSRNKFVPEPDITGVDTYIVRLHDLPVATYDGRIDGLASTKGKLNHTPGKHGKPNNNHGAEVSAYRQYLHSQQQAVMKLAQGKGIKNAIRHQFTDSLNAFTIDLTQQQAAALATLTQVDLVQRAGLRPMLTDRGPQFIGADQVWTGNTFPGGDYMGEGIIVGELDSGINTDNHPSFAAQGGDGYAVTNPLGSGTYLGDCAANASLCNDKLIGVWSWPVVTDTYQGVRPANGKDYSGHGSHTASTAAGNIVLNVPYMGPSPGSGIGHGVPTTNPGNPAGNFSFAQVSGVAPHANIIAYQVCYPVSGCPDEAILLATEQAINDQVDVINFSIGGTERFPWNDPIALAFLSARDAGIAVAAAAGNAGPNFYTLDHSAPWYIQVAAETHDRVLGTSNANKGGITLGGTAPNIPVFNATTPTGGISPLGTDPAQTYNLVVPSAMTPPLDAYCNTPFPPGTFQPTDIVVCKRGTITRVGKAFNVQAGGGGGIVVTNNNTNGTPPDANDLSSDDVYPIPGIQLQASQGSSLITWITTKAGTHTVQIAANTVTRAINAANGSQLAPFSSRGPSSTYFGSLSPNISAPGVRIFAAYSDEHPFDDPNLAASRDWAVLDGTSMATPHVTGTMALVRQAHPDWTPAEVQSALEMTAKDIVKGNDNGTGTLYPVGIYRAGNGQVDAQAAVNAGLVMDETADNFAIANPDNGGDVLQLNLPQLVNTFCQGVCSWVRTVRATRDGTWTTSNAPFIYEQFQNLIYTEERAKLTVTPSQFTLKAGQTQTLLVTADMTDVQYQQGGDGSRTTEQVELWSKLSFTPSDPAIPVAQWPISLNFDHGMLPKYLALTSHRDLGGYHLSSLPLPAMNSVAYRSHGLAKATTENVTVLEDSDHQPWYTNGGVASPSTTVRWLKVPAGASRLVTEVLSKVSSSAPAWTPSAGPFAGGHLKIWIGLDSNNDGQIDYVNETLCSSTTEEELNYCDISNPDSGNYWVVFQDARGTLSDNSGLNPTETFQIATAVVPAADEGSLTINGPASTTGNPVNLDVDWNLAKLNLQTGDVAYGGFDVGAGNAPGNVGFVPVKITRGIDDVTMTTSQTAAKPGDVVDVNLHVAENDSGTDRTFNLQSILPSGLTIVPGSVTVSTAVQRGNLQVNGNTVTIAGTQVDSENWPRTYDVTTSDNDPLCRTPILTYNGFATTGGHIGLYRHLGIAPTTGGVADGNSSQAQFVDFSNFWDGGWALYNNTGWHSYPGLWMSPQGWANTDQPSFLLTAGGINQMYTQQQFPFAGNTYTEIVAPLWKGVVSISAVGSVLSADTLNTPLSVNAFDPTQTSGMEVAYVPSTGDAIMEWIGARTYHLDKSVSPNVTTVLDDRYDIDLVVNKAPRYADGQYELMMTYDNINWGTQGGTQGMGSIGINGYVGPLDGFGPFYGYLGYQYAWNNLKSTLHNNLVVCYDYVGPESTQYDIAMKVRVAETAVGTTQLIRWTSHIDGMPDRNVDATITVSGTMKLAAIANQQTPFNTTLTGIPVVYTDSDGTPDTISVSGDHVTAVVNGNSPGSTFDLIPDLDFAGPTQVTVTVADQNNPANHVSTTFTLTVQVSHIQLSAIGDKSTRMETPLTGIPVNYVDSDGTPDTISVTGDHVTVVMHGSGPGSTFDLIPDAGFSGSTQITVKVSDQSNPADHASTTFTLTVSGEASIFMNGFD
jgi:subtilisin family serine protease